MKKAFVMLTALFFIIFQSVSGEKFSGNRTFRAGSENEQSQGIKGSSPASESHHEQKRNSDKNNMKQGSARNPVNRNPGLKNPSSDNKATASWAHSERKKAAAASNRTSKHTKKEAKNGYNSKNSEIKSEKAEKLRTSSSDKKNFTNSSEILNYRGTRKAVSSENLSIKRIKPRNAASGKTSVEVVFNQEINPRSFSSEKIKVNGKPVQGDIKFLFSRNGSGVKIQLPRQNEDFRIELSDIESFDGVVSEIAFDVEF